MSTEAAEHDRRRARRATWRLDTAERQHGARARRSTSWSTSTTRSPPARSASTSRSRSGSPRSTRRSASGLRAGELLLIGGAQGTGKTTMALQMARNVASGGQANVLYICFEHEEQYLLNRLIAMESALAHLPHKTGAIKIQDVRKEILGSWVAEGQGGRRSWPTTRASGRRSTGSPATARTCSSCAARRPPARSTTSASSSSSTRSCRATGACSSSSTTSRRCRSTRSRRPSRRR